MGASARMRRPPSDQYFWSYAINDLGQGTSLCGYGKRQQPQSSPLDSARQWVAEFNRARQQGAQPEKLGH